ncbi:unnamed protein product [Camellia sinensis]
MENSHNSEKSISFIRGRHARRKSSDITTPNSTHFSSIDFSLEYDPDENDNVDQLTQDVDRFTNTLSTVDDKSEPLEVPDSVETFSKIVESRIARYYSPNSPTIFGKMTEEDSFFFEAVRRISKLNKTFNDFSSTASSKDRTSTVLQRAMVFLEEEFRHLLEDSNLNLLLRKKQSDEEESDRDDESTSGQKEFPSYSPEIVMKMNRIATAMICAGYETECCQVYSIARRNVFNEAIKSLEFEIKSVEDVKKMQWETLEGEIATWIKVVKHCAAVLFPGERKLCDSVFSENPSIAVYLFSNLARAVVIQLLNFVDAVVQTNRSAEKLFKYLDMYEALRDLIPDINKSCSDELAAEISTSGDRIGEAAVHIFCDLENSIKGDAAKTPVAGGAVHPLTRYVMNYLKYACEYKVTLEQIFQKNKALVPSIKHERESPSHNQTGENSSSSPFATQLMTVIDLLDLNLETKSKLYKDPSLRFIFLMNNGRYIMQKIKAASEILQSMDDTWYRIRSSDVRQYHKNYQRETWGKVLHCLGHEGLQVNGKVHKPALKERFKNFSAMFDEIQKTQSTWVVSDEQLQSELRVSISAVVIPAYRSFFGRFRQYLDSGRQGEKYVKYQPEDIETMIEGLFDGNASSIGRKKN